MYYDVACCTHCYCYPSSQVVVVGGCLCALCCFVLLLLLCCCCVPLHWRDSVAPCRNSVIDLLLTTLTTQDLMNGRLLDGEGTTADASPPYIGIGSTPSSSSLSSKHQKWTDFANNTSINNNNAASSSNSSNNNSTSNSNSNADDSLRHKTRPRSNSTTHHPSAPSSAERRSAETTPQSHYSHNAYHAKSAARSMCSCWCDLFVSQTKENVGSRARDHLANEVGHGVVLHCRPCCYVGGSIAVMLMGLVCMVDREPTWRGCEQRLHRSGWDLRWPS
jgi:hypothetical protein